MQQEFKLHTTLERNDIREEEKLVFIQENPGIRFATPKITFGEGRQSRVSALEIIKADSTRKVIWKRCGVEKGLTKEEATLLAKHIPHYRESLQQFGWNVPSIFYSHVVHFDSGHVIFSYEELVEVIDAERMFKDENTAHFERLAVLQKVVATLTNNKHQSLVRKKYGDVILSSLPYGIDLKLANIILDARGELHFVDFFGPKELTPEGSWKTYSTKLDSLPEDSLLAVCATREGCIIRMLKLALRYLPSSLSKETYMKHYEDIVRDSLLPEEEKYFILSEVKNDFPLLASIYQEEKV